MSVKASLSVAVIIFAFTCTYKNRNCVFLVLEWSPGEENKVFGDLKSAGKNMDEKEGRSEDRGQ